MPISSGFSFYRINRPLPRRIVRPQIVTRAPKVNFQFLIERERDEEIEFTFEENVKQKKRSEKKEKRKEID